MWRVLEKRTGFLKKFQKITRVTDNFVMYDVNAKETRKHVMLYSRIFIGN